MRYRIYVGCVLSMCSMLFFAGNVLGADVSRRAPTIDRAKNVESVKVAAPPRVDMRSRFLLKQKSSPGVESVPLGVKKVGAFTLPVDQVSFVVSKKNGVVGDGDSYSPHISADGEYVVFISKAANIYGAEPSSDRTLIGIDLTSGQFKRLGPGTGDNAFSGVSLGKSSDVSSRCVAFVSLGENGVDYKLAVKGLNFESGGVIDETLGVVAGFSGIDPWTALPSCDRVITVRADVSNNVNIMTAQLDWTGANPQMSGSFQRLTEFAFQSIDKQHSKMWYTDFLLPPQYCTISLIQKGTYACPMEGWRFSLSGNKLYYVAIRSSDGFPFLLMTEMNSVFPPSAIGFDSALISPDFKNAPPIVAESGDRIGFVSGGNAYACDLQEEQNGTWCRNIRGIGVGGHIALSGDGTRLAWVAPNGYMAVKNLVDGSIFGVGMGDNPSLSYNGCVIAYESVFGDMPRQISVRNICGE